MKKVKAALALLLVMLTGTAQADMQLFVAEETISAQQAQALSRHLGEVVNEPVQMILQEDDGRSFSARIMDGGGMHLAIVKAGEMRLWAKEGLIAALDGLAVEDEMGVSDIRDCVADERLYALPLMEKARCMAVRSEFMDEIRMAYLLDKRNYPVWVPAQVLQVLDELALLGCAGMEMWLPQEEDALCFEAFLQGIGGAWFFSESGGVWEADMKAMKYALEWLEDMTHAGLIDTAQDREQALERFVRGETAIFIDWSQQESQEYAEEISSGEITLLPYPSTEGMPARASQMVCVVVMNGEEEARMKTAKQTALEIAKYISFNQKASGAPIEEGTVRLCALETLEGGATLRRLVCEAAADILSGREQAQEAAGKIARALNTAVH